MGKAAGESDFKIGTLPSLPDCIYIRDRTEMTTNRILDSLRMQAPLLSMTLPPLSILENMIPNLSYMSIGESASRVRHFLTESSPLHDIVLGRAKQDSHIRLAQHLSDAWSPRFCSCFCSCSCSCRLNKRCNCY